MISRYTISDTKAERNYLMREVYPTIRTLCQKHGVEFRYFKDSFIRGRGAWPYAGLSLPRVKESLIVIQKMQILHTSADIMYVCIHKNVLTMLQQKLHLSVKSKTITKF